MMRSMLAWRAMISRKPAMPDAEGDAGVSDVGNRAGFFCHQLRQRLA